MWGSGPELCSDEYLIQSPWYTWRTLPFLFSPILAAMNDTATEWSLRHPRLDDFRFRIHHVVLVAFLPLLLDYAWMLYMRWRMVELTHVTVSALITTDE